MMVGLVQGCGWNPGAAEGQFSQTLIAAPRAGEDPIAGEEVGPQRHAVLQPVADQPECQPVGGDHRDRMVEGDPEVEPTTPPLEPSRRLARPAWATRLRITLANRKLAWWLAPRPSWASMSTPIQRQVSSAAVACRPDAGGVGSTV
jgi:hypothetical protein